MTDPKYAAFTALDPFFDVVRQGLAGLVPPVPDYIEENGSDAGALTVSQPSAGTLASAFCIPDPGYFVIAAAANLPGPGATSLPGTFTVLP